MSEALIFASTNPQYDDRLFIELQIQYRKFPSSNLGTTHKNCFWHSEQFLYTTCSTHVLQKEELLKNIYLHHSLFNMYFEVHRSDLKSNSLKISSAMCYILLLVQFTYGLVNSCDLKKIETLLSDYIIFSFFINMNWMLFKIRL